VYFSPEGVVISAGLTLMALRPPSLLDPDAARS
jgi:hypothetical protein